MDGGRLRKERFQDVAGDISEAVISFPQSDNELRVIDARGNAGMWRGKS